MQRNKLASERYPNTTLCLAKECLGFLSKHSEVDISGIYNTLINDCELWTVHAGIEKNVNYDDVMYK